MSQRWTFGRLNIGKNLNSKCKFTKYTELSADLYSKITKHPNKEFEMPTLISICIGLGFSTNVSYYIIEKAGKKLRINTIEDRVYDFLLKNYAGQSIKTCNCFIDSVAENQNQKIRRLGTLSHSEKATN